MLRPTQHPSEPFSPVYQTSMIEPSIGSSAKVSPKGSSTNLPAFLKKLKLFKNSSSTPSRSTPDSTNGVERSSLSQLRRSKGRIPPPLPNLPTNHLPSTNTLEPPSLLLPLQPLPLDQLRKETVDPLLRSQRYWDQTGSYNSQRRREESRMGYVGIAVGNISWRIVKNRKVDSQKMFEQLF